MEQESHGSEESSSGPKESLEGSRDGQRLWPWEPQMGESSGIQLGPLLQRARPTRSPQGLRNVGDAHTSQPVSTGADGPAESSQPLSWPAPKLRRSLRRSSRAGKPNCPPLMKSAFQEDLLKKGAVATRPRRPSEWEPRPAQGWMLH